MSFSIVTSLASLNANAQLTKTNFGLQQALGGLSSGLRINSAADDAGRAIANRDRTDVAGLQVSMRNSIDAISRLQLEDGALNNISLLLDRCITLPAQPASAQARLDLRRKQLQQQFAAADEAISKRNAMTGQLSQLGSSKRF